MLDTALEYFAPSPSDFPNEVIIRSTGTNAVCQLVGPTGRTWTFTGVHAGDRQRYLDWLARHGFTQIKDQPPTFQRLK